MKKVFLSLAIVAALTVVSCKQAEAEATEAVDSVATEVVEEAAPVVDSAAAVVDSAATEAAPATEEAAAPAEKK
ncbi:MAG: hypothetical protein JNJ52_05040 [Flavobacterium sp.]|nr:hypothetical protein [Flavobacterium sp.]